MRHFCRRGTATLAQHQLLLGYALDIAAALQRDQSRSLAQRHARDRHIAQTQELLPVPADRTGQLRTIGQWWQQAQQLPDFATTVQAPLAGATFDRARRAGGYILLAFGMLLGSAVAAAALRYDGSAPVNLITVIAALVVIPGVMLMLTLMLLPGRIRGLGWLQDVLATFSPGQWLSAWLNRRFAQSDLGWQGRLSMAAELSAVAAADYRRIGKWQLVLYSQLLAVGFFVAALATLMLLVTFSDLAFGWSTTLDVAVERVIGWVQALSRPWAALLPGAAPDAQLIAQSQFYRAADLDTAQVTALGDWWPFLALVIAVYGLLPRAVLLLIAGARLRRAEQQLLLQHPQILKLFERMGAPIVTHAVDVAESAETARTQPEAPMVSGKDRWLQLPAGKVVLVNWNQALPGAKLSAWLAQHADRQPERCVELGARTSAQEEQQLLDQLHADSVVVLAKAWEPPLLEFIDVTRRLKQALDPAGVVLVVPVGIEGRMAEAADLGIWQQVIGNLDDVRVRVGAGS